jgi:hypothetical protein
MTTHEVGSAALRAAGDDHDGRLRLALNLDAAVSGAFGLLLLAAAPLLQDMLGAPLALVWPIGLVAVAYAAYVWFAASADDISRRDAWSVVVANLLWVAASVVVLVAGWFPLTALGTTFVIAQALVVALLAALQVFGLRPASR